jgi:hypothetical protein
MQVECWEVRLQKQLRTLAKDASRTALAIEAKLLTFPELPGQQWRTASGKRGLRHPKSLIAYRNVTVPRHAANRLEVQCCDILCEIYCAWGSASSLSLAVTTDCHGDTHSE